VGDHNPEATASALSTAFYLFMDTTVQKAQRIKQIAAADLPALLEADNTAFLAARAGEHMGPAGHVHLFWSLVCIFRGTLGLQVALNFAKVREVPEKRAYWFILVAPLGPHLIHESDRHQQIALVSRD
jgi:hypothetical protein